MRIDCFIKALSEKSLLADGATGSNLFNMGLQTGDAPELWNTIYPDRVREHYHSFISAGSDIILTNTFGANASRLKLHKSSHQVDKLNYKGASLLKSLVLDSTKPIFVAGSIGPTGDIMEPLGALTFPNAVSIFTEQAIALKAGGADLLWIETMSSIQEAQAALAGANKTGLPVIVSFSIDTNGRTMMGHSPADLYQELYSDSDSLPPLGVGFNCGIGAAETIAAAINFKQAAVASNEKETNLVLKANCGVPQYQDGKIAYSGSIELMKEYTKLAISVGAKIIGGCCGTTPAHIASMREVMDAYENGDNAKCDLKKIIQTLGEVSAGGKAQMIGKLSIEEGAKTKVVRSKLRRRKKTA